MSVSNPEEKIEWGADSEHGKNERVPSSAILLWVKNRLIDIYFYCEKSKDQRRQTKASLLIRSFLQGKSALHEVCQSESHKEMSSTLDEQSALVFEPNCGVGGGVAGSQPMSTAVHVESK
jgi:hypothetical protein